MNPTKIRCPHCGNSILIKQSGKSVCPSCGTPLYIEEKDKSVNVNVTLGNIEKSEAKQKGFFLVLLAFILLSVFFMLFLPGIFRMGRKVQKTVAPKYETSLHDPVLTRLFAEAFEKDPASITEEDYARVKTISFQRELSGLQWLKVGFTDDSEKRIPLVYDERTVEIDGTDFQVFPNLEGLYVGETATGGDVRLSYESEEYAHTLANLTKLKYLHLSERSSYDRTPKELAAFVANPAQIEELNGVSLYDAEDVEELVKYFPKSQKADHCRSRRGCLACRFKAAVSARTARDRTERGRKRGSLGTHGGQRDADSCPCGRKSGQGFSLSFGPHRPQKPDAGRCHRVKKSQCAEPAHRT